MLSKADRSKLDTIILELPFKEGVKIRCRPRRTVESDETSIGLMGLHKVRDVFGEWVQLESTYEPYNADPGTIRYHTIHVSNLRIVK